jgi:hypothetical protein
MDAGKATESMNAAGGADGRNRTDTPFGNSVLNAARLPIPPRPQSPSYSLTMGQGQVNFPRSIQVGEGLFFLISLCRRTLILAALSVFLMWAA